MTKLLSIAPQPDAPIACDMSSARDTLAERLAEYRRLFEHALIGRESTETATTFRFAARPGVREWVCNLAQREAACCSFLAYDIDQEGEEIVWTTGGGLGAPEMAILDEFPGGPGSVPAVRTRSPSGSKTRASTSSSQTASATASSDITPE